MKSIQWTVLALLLAASGSLPLLAFHEGGHDDAPAELYFNVGKNGEINIGADVKIGNRTIKKGKYAVNHRPDGDRHVFTLSEVDKKKAVSQLVTVEFDTRLARNSEVVKSSKFLSRKLKDGSYEVVNIQIAGENGDHVVVK